MNIALPGAGYTISNIPSIRIEVPVGTPFDEIDLPKTVEATLNTGDTVMLKVNPWPKPAGFNSNIINKTYASKGTLVELPLNVSNRNNRQPNLAIKIIDPSKTVISKTLLQNNTFSLFALFSQVPDDMIEVKYEVVFEDEFGNRTTEIVTEWEFRD